MSIIVSCDPGGIKPGTHSGTGYAVLDTESMKVPLMQISNHNPRQCASIMQDLYRGYMTDHVVTEGFKPRWGQPFSLDSVYLIGGMQALIGEDRLKIVFPSQHMTVVPKPKLTQLMKSEGWKIGEGHSRMALSVAVYYAGFVLKERTVLDWLSKES